MIITQVPVVLTKINVKKPPVPATSSVRNTVTTAGSTQSTSSSRPGTEAAPTAKKPSTKAAKYKMSDVPEQVRKDFDEVIIPIAKKLTATLRAFKRPTVEQLQELMNANIAEYEFDLDSESIYTYLVRTLSYFTGP